MNLVQEPMPDPARREAQAAVTTRQADDLAGSVTRERAGTDISPPEPPKARLRLDRREPPRLPGELEALSKGWESLNAGDAQGALASFGEASGSRDKLLAQEATLGKAYALWRLGRADQAEALFTTLADQEYRLPEVLPNLLLLLYKRGGPKAVEPYLHLLPEQDRDAWRK